MTVRAVTFDFWQTLVSERRGDMRAMQIDRWVDTLADAGQPRTREELVAVFDANWAIFEERWRDNHGQYGATDSVTFVTDHLGIELADGLHATLLDNFRIVGESAPLQLARGVEGCLQALHDAGVALGIVCDVGLTGAPVLRRRLEGFGLLRYFDAWSFSDETGWFKPAAGAFEPALDGLGRPRGAGGARRRQRAHGRRRREGPRDDRCPVHRSGVDRRLAPGAGTRLPRRLTSSTTWPPCPAS